MTASYAKGALTEAQRLATFAQIRGVLEGKQVFTCEEDIYSDASAPLLEATKIAASLALWPLCQDMATVRPGLASVRTLTADAVWSGRMDAWSRRPRRMPPPSRPSSGGVGRFRAGVPSLSQPPRPGS